MAKQRAEKVYHIVVAGMSGTEAERGPTGVGKSCLCNRFMQPHADDYYNDHISVISSSDFSGRIVNNDHFLYWGQVTKKWDGDPMTFSLVEQTEFIDDSSFSPLRGSNTHSYYKRAAVTTLKSAEKVMYICKDQVGDETNFEQTVLPDGKFPVDGFLIVYDVSKAPGHDKQFEWLSKLHSQLNKTRKPIVIVATKWDEATDPHVTQVRNFASKVKSPLIETSSQEGVNVELAFVTLAHKIDKKGAPREVPFSAANEARRKLINKAMEEYESMLQRDVTDYHDRWAVKRKRFQNNEVFKRVVELVGTKNAKTCFQNHTKRLKMNHQQNKMKLYLGRLPDALESIFPDLNSIRERDWTVCHEILPKMPNFADWFVILPNYWRHDDYIDSDELHIPYDVLKDNERECENCFTDHVNRLNAAKRKEKMKEDLQQLLDSLENVILPNSSLDEEAVIDSISEHECYKELDPGTRVAIYKVHQDSIQQRALQRFAELLQERHEVLVGVDITQPARAEVEKVEKALEYDPRYKKLSEMKDERSTMLIKHLIFAQDPTTNSCYYEDKCMEKQIQACIDKNVKNRSPVKDTLSSLEEINNKLSFLIMGEDGLADELESDIRSQSYDGDYTLDKVLYSLDMKTIEGDITLPRNQFVTERFTPQGLLCVCTSLEGFQYVKSCLENTILSGRNEFNTLLYRSLPIVLMFGRSTSPEADTAQVKEQALHLCSRLNNGHIVNVPAESGTLWRGKFSEPQIQEALRHVAEHSKNSAQLNQMESERGMKGSKTFRIGLCMPCGDPFQPDLVLSPITSHACSPTPPGDDHSNGDSSNCISCDMFLIDAKCRVEFEVASYHLADRLRDERMHHGYILVYAAQRKASFQMLRWFLKIVQPIPTLVVAVCEDIHLAADGIADGTRLVDQYKSASIITAYCSSFRDQTVIYNSFLKSAYDRRRETEKLNRLNIEDNISPSPSIDRPPIDLPSTPSHEDVHTPNSGDYQDVTTIPGRRNSAKTTNEGGCATNEGFEDSPPTAEDGMYASVDKNQLKPDSSAEALYGTVDKTPAKPESVPEGLYGTVDKTPAKPESVPEGLYGTVEKTPAKPESVPEGSCGTTEKPRKPPKPKLAPKPAVKLSSAQGKVEKKVDNTGINGVRTPEQVYGQVDRSRKTSTTPTPDKPANDAPIEQGIYAVVDRSSKAKPSNDVASESVPEDEQDDMYGKVERRLERKKEIRDLGGRIVPRKEEYVTGGLFESINKEWSLRTGQTTLTGSGMVENTLYDSYTSQDPHSGMVDNVLYGPRPSRPSGSTGSMEGMVENELYGSQPSRPSGSTGSVEEATSNYASVDELQEQRGNFNQNVPWAAPTEAKRVGPPPTAPKPGVQKVRPGPTPLRAPPPVLPPMVPPGGAGPDSHHQRVQEVATPTRQTPAKNSSKQRDIFIEGLTKLLEEDSTSNSIQEATTTPGKKKKPKDKEKTPKKKQKGARPYTTPSKKPNPPLESLTLSENGLPPFIEQCVQRIEDEGIAQEGIYRMPGKATDIEAIMKMFDENQNVDFGQIENLSSNTIASVLKNFFKSLPDPIIPYHIQEKMMLDYKEFNDEERFVRQLPEYLRDLSPVRISVLQFMMNHMKRITDYSEKNLMTAENISICLWPSILHPQSKSFDDLANEAVLATIFRLMLENSHKLF